MFVGLFIKTATPYCEKSDHHLISIKASRLIAHNFQSIQTLAYHIQVNRPLEGFYLSSGLGLRFDVSSFLYFCNKEKGNKDLF